MIPHIPSQLKEWSFVKVRSDRKEAFEPGSPRYEFENPDLKEHLAKNGNYGVSGNGEHGHIIIDADSDELGMIIRTLLPKTFTVTSAIKRKPHFYFKCKWTRGDIALTDWSSDNPKAGNIGTIRAKGYCVGPFSTVEGRQYLIADASPVSEISEEQLLGVLSPWIAEKTQTVDRQLWKGQDLEFEITNISGIKAGLQIHPVHGSKSNTRNLHVDPKRGLWFCFACCTGGDSLQLLAVTNKIIGCWEAGPGALRGEKFKKAKERATELGLIEKREKKAYAWKPLTPVRFLTATVESSGLTSLSDNGHDLVSTVKPPNIEPPQISEETTPDEAADALLSIYRVLTIAGSGRSGADEILYYREGVYVTGAEAIISRTIEDNFHDIGLADVATSHFVNETLGHVRRRTYVQRDAFDSDPFILNVKNGLLDLRTYELKPHSPDYPSLSQLPVAYDPIAKCPRFIAFLDEVTYQGDSDPLQEFVGGMLWAEPIQQAMLLDGSGGNGKGVFIGAVKAVLGQPNICARSLLDLEFNRFATADLYGKRANIYADLPDTALKTTGRFKILTGGEPVTAEKKFGQPFTWVPYAKHMYSCNKIPETFEDTTAFWRRWILITFPNTFVGGKDNRNLLRELTTPRELSGVLNWAVEGLYRLQGHDWKFSYSKSIELVREEYIRKSSPIKAFLMDCVTVNAAADVVKEDLFGAFVEYCKGHNLPVVTKGTFFRNLPMHAKIESARLEKDGKRKYCFMGLCLKDRRDWGRKEEEEDEEEPVFNATDSGRCSACGKEAALGLDRSGQFLICRSCFGGAS